MIRRDYILRMIEEFMQILSSLIFLKRERRWRELEGTLDQQFQQLAGTDAAGLLGLSETELSARLMRGESTNLVEHKIRFLIRLCKEAGDAAVAQERLEQGRAFYLKGLGLLVQNSEVELPVHQVDFVPRVDAFIEALGDAPLPPQTAVLLLLHYERMGLFARAEDTLFAMLDDLGNSPEALDFGIALYERLRCQSDATLLAGDLPRTELEASLAELQTRRAALSATA